MTSLKYILLSLPFKKGEKEYDNNKTGRIFRGADTDKKLGFFKIIFHYAYQSSQNGLKYMILKEKIQIHIFTFQNIL